MNNNRDSWTIGTPESYRAKEEVYYIRMNIHERCQHHLVWSTFIILAVTGFMVEFPETWLVWLGPYREAVFYWRGLLHRIAAIVMVGNIMYQAGRVGGPDGAHRGEGRVVLLFDNLESIQDPDTLALTDERASAWIEAAGQVDGLVLLATSRWKLPGWVGEHLQLAHASYGDFLQMAQQWALRGQMQMGFLEQRERLRQVYEVLGGNSRGLELFAAATRGMEQAEEDDFLQKLAQTQTELPVTPSSTTAPSASTKDRRGRPRRPVPRAATRVKNHALEPRPLS